MVKNRCASSSNFNKALRVGRRHASMLWIGIAARPDEHLALLRQLTHVLW